MPETVGLVEPFDLYSGETASSPGLFGSWNQEGSGGVAAQVALVEGLNGHGLALSVNSTNSGKAMRRNIPARTQFSWAFAIQWTFIPNVAHKELFMWNDINNSHQFGLAITPAGTFRLIGENSATIATGNIAMTPGQKYRVTFKVDLTTPGDNSFSLKISGEEDTGLTVTGVDLLDSATEIEVAMFKLDFPSDDVGANFWAYVIDDIFDVYDAQPDLPELELFCEAIAAETADKDWTPSTGTNNAEMIDEVIPDSDTTYNSSDTVGAKDMFTLAAYSRVPESIYALSLATFARKEESATRTLRSIFRPDVTEYPGADYNLQESYDWDWNHALENPETAAPWVAADHDALEVGYELRV